MLKYQLPVIPLSTSGSSPRPFPVRIWIQIICWLNRYRYRYR
uniref:Uncharacterized protein n=1 Tax=Anguilla anguilla TaxID=7936 RepID=A0A0E9TJ78_ANGAN